MARPTEEMLNATPSAAMQPNSRMYFMQDANWSATAVLSCNGTAGMLEVTQQFAYSPFGTTTIFTSDWSATAEMPLASKLHRGMTIHPVAGLYYGRNQGALRSPCDGHNLELRQRVGAVRQ